MAFLEAFVHMPSYVNFQKELVSTNWKFDECREVALSFDCCLVVPSDLPRKYEAYESFHIPIAIEEVSIPPTLVDLGDKINSIPLTFFKHLDISEYEP